MGKIFEIVWWVSMDYFINAWMEKVNMLPNYGPYDDLDAYRRGMTFTNYFGVKMGKKRR